MNATKRMVMSHDGSMTRIACDDGSILVIDAINGESYKLKNNRQISKPKHCPHAHTEPYIVDRAGGNVDICLDCGEKIDPDQPPEPDVPNFEDIEEIPF